MSGIYKYLQRTLCGNRDVSAYSAPLHHLPQTSAAVVGGNGDVGPEVKRPVDVQSLKILQ